MALAAIALVGCGKDASAPASSGNTVSLAFATRPAGVGSASVIASGADRLTITSAEIVLSHIELAQAGMMACADVDSGDDNNQAMDHDDCDKLEVSPMVVQLPTDTTVVTSLTLHIPPGNYRALEARLASSSLLAAPPDIAGASVQVMGTFDGQPFTYTGTPHAKIELSFNPPLAVADSTTNITVHVDLSTWFVNRSGALINPSTADPGGPNQQVVTDNITRSFQAFEDDHRHGRGHGGGPGPH